MRVSTVLVLFISLLLSSCVGTVEDSNKNYTETIENPKLPLTFQGIFSASAISDTKIEVFFYPATGGSGTYTYDIIVASNPVPFSVPSDVLKPDFRGLLKYTLTGLSKLSTYSIKVEVREKDSNIQSTSNIARTVQTFDNQVADFQGISSAYNMPGQDGKDSLKVRWTPARASGGLTLQDWDPRSYEVVLVDSTRLTPNDMDLPYSSAQGRWVASFNSDETLNEYIVRGLPTKTKFYVRIRALHEASTNDVYNPKKRSELNTNYVTISTLSAELADIKFEPDAFAVTLANGEQGLSAVNSSWKQAEGVFDHYRIYYGLTGGGVGSGSLPANCLSPLLSPVGATVFCKKVAFNLTSSPSTGLTAYTSYEVVLVLCANTACGPLDRILSPVRTIVTDPNTPNFNGVRDVMSSQSISEVGNLYVRYDPPNFTSGFFEGLVLKMRRTIDGTDAAVEITGSTPIFHMDYNMLTNNQIVVKGVGYLDVEPYCFTLYPYKIGLDGVTRNEMPNNIWKCIQPRVEAPTNQQFLGLNSASSDRDSVNLTWQVPTSGIFSHYELFWRKQSGAGLVWGDAISQTSNFNYTNYGRLLVDAEETNITLTGFSDGDYTFGILTYFTYVTDGGSVTLRSETNANLKRCSVNNASVVLIVCQ